MKISVYLLSEMKKMQTQRNSAAYHLLLTIIAIALILYPFSRQNFWETFQFLYLTLYFILTFLILRTSQIDLSLFEICVIYILCYEFPFFSLSIRDFRIQELASSNFLSSLKNLSGKTSATFALLLILAFLVHSINNANFVPDIGKKEQLTVKEN